MGHGMLERTRVSESRARISIRSADASGSGLAREPNAGVGQIVEVEGQVESNGGQRPQLLTDPVLEGANPDCGRNQQHEDHE